MNNDSGFTFIEVVVSLVIISILAAVAGLFTVFGVKEYAFTRENNAIAQKARLAMSRIERELTEMSAIDAAASDGTCVRYKVGSVSADYRAISLNGTNLELKATSETDRDCGSPGFVLVGNVSGFNIKYEDKAGTSPIPSTPPLLLSDLVALHMDFTLNRADGAGSEQFEIIINARNNGNMNGPGVP
jgi:prepilin-type N-terminal cleavage/methylation domain-containing protein